MGISFKDLNDSRAECNKLRERIAALESENAELRKDKERLDWLDANWRGEKPPSPTFAIHFAASDNWRAAIDSCKRKS